MKWIKVVCELLNALVAIAFAMLLGLSMWCLVEFLFIVAGAL